jgi:DNA-binding FadR family transcriptional regulator
VIRESVLLLQDKGLVRIIQGKGTLVLDPQSWNMIDDVVLSAVVRHDDTLGILEELIVVRAALEREMAAAAAGRVTPAQVEQLSEAFSAMRRAAADADEFALADVRFHDVVMEVSGNRLARAIVSSIHDKARANLRYHGSTSADMIARTLDEHRAILDAIGRHDPAAANHAMHTHITSAWARRRPEQS